MALDLNTLRKQYETLTKGGDYFSPTDPKTQIRILPPWNNLQTIPFKKTGYHEILGERYNCPKEIKNEPCPICNKSRSLYKSKREEDVALARELRAIQRFFFNIIVRGQEEKGVQKFGCGKKITEKIMSIMLNELQRDITDPQDGNDIMIVKTMQGDYPDYSSSYAIHQSSPLNNMKWLQQLHDLDSAFVTKSYDELCAVLDKKLSPTISSAYVTPATTVVQPATVVQPIAEVVQPETVVDKPAEALPPSVVAGAKLSAEEILGLLK